MKKTLVLLFCFLIGHSVWGASVDEKRALQLARRFLSTASSTTQTKSLNDNLTLAYVEGQVGNSSKGNSARSLTNANPAYYVFNRGTDGGFVMVAGDDALTPVFAYSNQGTFNAERIPDGLVYYLDCYAQMVKMARAGELKIKKRFFERGDSLYGPLITTQWGQGEPFNDLAPLYQGKKAVAGCGPIANAQIMKYHRWPERGIRDMDFTHTWCGVDYSVDFTQSVYDWDNMLDVYADSIGYTQAQRDAVAKLVFDQDIACQVATDDKGTGSGIASGGLKYYFGYSDDETISRIYFSDAEWYGYIRWDLSWGRPVKLCAIPIGLIGHIFICDGIDTNNWLHINWGWSGAGDGFYYMDDFDFFNAYHLHSTASQWVYDHCMNWNMAPDRPDYDKPMLPLASGFSGGLSDVPLGQNQNVTIYDEKAGGINRPWQLAVALYSVDDEFVRLVSEPTAMHSTEGTYEVGMVLPEDLADGRYSLRVLFRMENTEDWMIPYGVELYKEFEVADGTARFAGLKDAGCSIFNVRADSVFYVSRYGIHGNLDFDFQNNSRKTQWHVAACFEEVTSSGTPKVAKFNWAQCGDNLNYAALQSVFYGGIQQQVRLFPLATCEPQFAFLGYNWVIGQGKENGDEHGDIINEAQAEEYFGEGHYYRLKSVVSNTREKGVDGEAVENEIENGPVVKFVWKPELPCYHRQVFDGYKLQVIDHTDIPAIPYPRYEIYLRYIKDEDLFGASGYAPVDIQWHAYPVDGSREDAVVLKKQSYSSLVYDYNIKCEIEFDGDDAIYLPQGDYYVYATYGLGDNQFDVTDELGKVVEPVVISVPKITFTPQDYTERLGDVYSDTEWKNDQPFTSQHNFQYLSQISSDEYEGDAFESWSSASDAPVGRAMYRTIEELPDGMYRLSAFVLAKNQLGQGDQEVYFYANNQRTNCYTGTMKRFTLEDIVVRGGRLEFGLKVASKGAANWLAMGALWELTYLGPDKEKEEAILGGIAAKREELGDSIAALTELSAALTLTTSGKKNVRAAISAAQAVYDTEAVSLDELEQAIVSLIEARRLCLYAQRPPADFTFAIENPGFVLDDTGWEGPANVRCDACEVYNSPFDIYQTLSGLPRGTYTLTVQGFYRYGGDGPSQAAAYKGAEPLHAYLYANDRSVLLPSIFSDGRDAAFEASDAYSALGYVPNTMEGASARFRDGSYQQSFTFVVRNEDVRIGVKKEVSVPKDWCIFTNFRLSYVSTSTVLPTGIQETGCGDVKTTAYYMLDGRKVDSPCRGIYIVHERLSDGSTRVRKVLVR
jgi:putative thiol protease/hemagglutinin prtT